MSNNPSPLPTVRTEIDNGNPLGARIGWNQGGGHFVAIFGYDDTDEANELLSIGDPWSGNSIVAYDEFTSNYQGSGKWTHSYFTRP